ncbi:GGDEF domain-containing protein [uncultured Treponema sp.]|uniref:GGDEF domain-containing protein n=1 Tax=uncultured Treponema sp. TaxID=162155 RepID=UPI0025FD34AD|nr:GGDEF domain-containing protein [uncultured Treponema sp.]
MDFQSFVNTFSVSCAVLSVKKSSTGHPGEIRIVKSNDIYKSAMGVARYRDNMIYSELVPKELLFEDYCYRCAFKKQKLNTYLETPGLHCWSVLTLIPIEGGNEEIGYCAFFLEQTRNVNPEIFSQVSAQTAASVIKSCVALRGEDDFQTSINDVIAEIQQKAESFCCVLLTLDRINEKYEVLAEKFRDREGKVRNYEKHLTYEVVNSWEETIGNTFGVVVKDEHDMQLLNERNPIWVESLKASDVKNLILYPLKQSKKIIGYIFITNFDTSKLLEIQEVIDLTAFFISSEIASHYLMKKLELLSNTDILTGVRNRNAMNTRVDLFVTKEQLVVPPFGVVFADLNGLKQINDNKGHEAGDNLIKSAAQIIKQVFKNYEIYRAGGDEFVVICPACDESEFVRKVLELKAKTVYGSPVCLAVGSHWDMYGENLRLAMHLADEQMYKEKEEFYRQHAEMRRNIREL